MRDRLARRPLAPFALLLVAAIAVGGAGDAWSPAGLIGTVLALVGCGGGVAAAAWLLFRVPTRRAPVVCGLIGATTTGAFVLWGDAWDPYGVDIGLGGVLLLGLVLLAVGSSLTVVERRDGTDLR